MAPAKYRKYMTLATSGPNLALVERFEQFKGKYGLIPLTTSKSFSESILQERLPTARALTVSEQVYSHSDTTRDRCFTCGKDHSLVSCDQFLKSSVTKIRQAIYNYSACYMCFKANHLAKNCPTKIKCHHCDAPHHPLLCELGDGVHSSDETNTSKFNNSSSFTVKIGVWVLSAVGPTELSMCLERHL